MGLREQIGRYGAWVSERSASPELAAGLEAAGYGALWLGSASADLAAAERFLGATRTLVVGTGIVNVWQTDPEPLAEAYARVAGTHGDRFFLGVGTGHREAFGQYAKPYETLAGFVDTLLARGVPADRLVLAALGPRVLALAGERTAGAHPYLVPVEHTRRARAELGPGPLLAPEHKVVLGPDRALGREKVENPYLHLDNYVRNLRRLGYSEVDLLPPGSDRLVDDVVAHGTPAAIAAALAAHLDAGADHVAVQALGPDPLAVHRALAPALSLSPAAG
jgi:probable F420-dependent oxidoreductase